MTVSLEVRADALDVLFSTRSLTQAATAAGVSTASVSDWAKAAHLNVGVVRGRKAQPVKHGTLSGWSTGCRCLSCKDARKSYDRERRGFGERRLAPEVRGDAMDTLTRTRNVRFAAELAGVDWMTVHRWARAAGCLPARPVKPIAHGTHRGYVRGCRCDECAAANTEHHRVLRARRHSREIPATVQHGTTSTYGNWGCRCDACFAAKSIQNRDQQLGQPRRRIRVTVEVLP